MMTIGIKSLSGSMLILLPGMIGDVQAMFIV
jgi:hypothetical protein